MKKRTWMKLSCFLAGLWGQAYAATVTLTTIMEPGLSVSVTNPTLGSFFEVNQPASPETLSLYTNGTAVSSDPTDIEIIGGSGATNGQLHITGATTGTANASIIGPDGVTGIFPITGPASLNARLYQATTQSGAVGALVQGGIPFSCTLSSGACDIYLGAEIDIPTTPAVTPGNYSSSAMTITLQY